jgi:hypothetical protein
MRQILTVGGGPRIIRRIANPSIPPVEGSAAQARPSEGRPLRAWLLVVCLLAAGTAVAAKDAPEKLALDGSWVGSRNGVAVTWELSTDGRLRLDGRGADYRVHGDTLTVLFDRVDPNAPTETAIYRFTPEEGTARIFVYGFDLGRQGMVLTRTRRDEVAEDASPPPPPPPQKPRTPERTRRESGGGR